MRSQFCHAWSNAKIDRGEILQKQRLEGAGGHVDMTLTGQYRAVTDAAKDVSGRRACVGLSSANEIRINVRPNEALSENEIRPSCGCHQMDRFVF